MLFSQVLFSHVHAAAATLAAAVTPSLANPLALAVALGGLGMAVAMLLAAFSFKRPAAGEASLVNAQAIAAALAEPPIRTRSVEAAAARPAKALV